MPRYWLLPLLCCLLFSCVPAQKNAPVPAAPVQAGVQPLAILRAGEYPLWFELGEEGPAQIASAEDAALSPFRPWPLARHIRFVLALGEELVMAVNGDGFLRLAAGKAPPPDSEMGMGYADLFRHAFAVSQRDYTTTSLFIYGGRPAVLLYRDDFFVESGAALPSPRACVIAPDESAPQPLELPAFAAWPPGEGWDADALRLGPDGFWYFRLVKKNLPRPEIVYRRSRNLNGEGEAVSLGAFQNSALPEPTGAAPPALRSALNAAFALSGGASAEVVSPDFAWLRHFAAGGGNAGETGLAETGGGRISGYYRRNGEGAFALAALPDGRGFFAREAAGGAEIRSFTLPPLPEKFVYTHIGLAGDTLFAAWEEQEDFSIGAAGFMVIKTAEESGPSPFSFPH
ncbi:MAG: hypothetical protein LBS57_04415 [Treponema sp.]|jgi:hypothetical protein|nr:hypothetical protein [Treponema sp.]